MIRPEIRYPGASQVTGMSQCEKGEAIGCIRCLFLETTERGIINLVERLPWAVDMMAVGIPFGPGDLSDPWGVHEARYSFWVLAGQYLSIHHRLGDGDGRERGGRRWYW